MKRTLLTSIVLLVSLFHCSMLKAQETSRAAATEAEIGNIIVNLNTAEWGQGSPYNKLCFTSGGKQAVTGCVPTAYAILMQYHKWPLRAIEKTVYHSGTGESITLGHEYDWDNMLDNYAYGYSGTQAIAVAKLMRDLGYTYQVEYGTSSTVSGGGGEGAAKLIEVFKYKSESPNTSSATMATSRDVLGNDELWVQYIKESLDAGCPIPYSSSTTSGGRHIFILDGYTDNGYFHFNWGWGGNGNGWFKLDDMTPDANSDYSKSHKAYFMLKPDREAAITDITITAESTEGGTATVNGKTEALVAMGSVITLTAAPHTGYRFVEWRAGTEVVSKNTTFSTTAYNNKTYTAYFEEATSSTVTIKVKGSGGYFYVGTGESREIEVTRGSTVRIRAAAAEGTGRKFAYWSTGNTVASGKGTILTNSNPYDFTANENMTFYVNFVSEETDLNVNIIANASQGGKATVNGAAQQNIALGSSITFLATADNGYKFTSWTDEKGNTISTEPVYPTVARATTTLTANFEALTEITEVEAGDNSPGSIHDLQGRKINHIAKPNIYIVNGKKILVK